MRIQLKNINDVKNLMEVQRYLNVSNKLCIFWILDGRGGQYSQGSNVVVVKWGYKRHITFLYSSALLLVENHSSRTWGGIMSPNYLKMTFTTC